MAYRRRTYVARPYRLLEPKTRGADLQRLGMTVIGCLVPFCVCNTFADLSSLTHHAALGLRHPPVLCVSGLGRLSVDPVALPPRLSRPERHAAITHYTRYKDLSVWVVRCLP